MKKLNTIFSALMLCIGLIATLSSCSDSNDENITPAAKSIAGVYEGDMTCTVMGSESVFEDMVFTVDATDDASVTVKISAFGNPPMAVPEITIADVKVSGTDGEYALATTEFSGTTDAGKAYSGTLLGNSSNNILTIKFNLKYGAMPMPMICSFTAPKK